MILYTTISTYVRDEIKKLRQRYADRLEEYPNTLAINLMSKAETSRRLKRTLPQDLYPASGLVYATGYVLFKTSQIVKCITECYM